MADYTTAELEIMIRALEAKLAKGELRVDYADRSVTYRSVADLLAALEYFKGQLVALTAATSTRSRQSYGVASAGF